MTSRILALLVAAMVVRPGAGAEPWQPAQGPLLTRWAKDVSPERVWPEYPRPHLVRAKWQNLNGLWSYAVQPRGAEQPAEFPGKILVPFPIESALSGVMERVSHEQRLWYRRSFEVPQDWRSGRVLLHFGAVDWESTVWVNGKEVGTHRGGYDPFTLDVTEALRGEGAQELVVAVWDPTDQGFQPRGKQVQRPEGIWYTPTTGIWQTVWLEPVPPAHLRRLKITPDVERSQLRVELAGQGLEAPLVARLAVYEPVAAAVGEQDRQLGKELASVSGPADQPLVVTLAEPKLWSPQRPALYDLRVQLLDGGVVVDSVLGYAGMRKVALGKDQYGVTRIMLNGEPVFQYGPLDQGFWPDGLYTAPTDEALRYDIEVTRRLGFNMARKHVKVEPARWYYWCDRLGLLVWQDMPSGDAHVAPGRGEIERSPESAANFLREWQAVIDANHQHPSIVMWVPFNEGWGQFDTVRVTEWTQRHDPTRLVICASGWNDFPAGDAHDIHVYPGPGAPEPEARRAAVLGEFGGLGLPVRGHTWQDEKNWGYRSFTDAGALSEAYLGLLQRLHPLVGAPGLSAAVYTQTTDVEIEVNGLMTYDRAQIKIDEARLIEAHRRLSAPPPKSATLVPTSHKPGVVWRYTTEQPAEGWMTPAFDDQGWAQGQGGFGREGTPGAVVRTIWTSPDVWLRRTIVLPDRALGELQLLLHHDEDVRVYLNGVLAAEAGGHTTDYGLVPVSDAARAALRTGENLLALHCRQTAGGQYVDAGLVELLPAGEPLRAAALAGQWQSLFDGKSLGNWKPTVFGGQGEVTVEEGKIVLPVGSELTGITWTGPLPRMNYEFSVDAMRVDGVDFFCGLTFPVADDPCSLIIGGWGGGVVGLSSIDGRDASMNDTTQYREFEKGRWYNIRVRVTPTRIEAWIDGAQVIDQAIEGKKVSIRPEVELSKPLGIASYATKAALRNIRLRTIDPAQVEGP